MSCCQVCSDRTRVGGLEQSECVDMNQNEMMSLAIAAGIVFAAYRFGSGAVKAGALAVGAMIVAKQVPYVKDVI